MNDEDLLAAACGENTRRCKGCGEKEWRCTCNSHHRQSAPPEDFNQDVQLPPVNIFKHEPTVRVEDLPF